MKPGFSEAEYINFLVVNYMLQNLWFIVCMSNGGGRSDIKGCKF